MQIHGPHSTPRTSGIEAQTFYDVLSSSSGESYAHSRLGTTDT